MNRSGSIVRDRVQTQTCLYQRLDYALKDSFQPWMSFCLLPLLVSLVAQYMHIAVVYINAALATCAAFDTLYQTLMPHSYLHRTLH